MQHCPSAIFPAISAMLGSPSPPGIISGIMPAPIFGIIGMPFSSNFSPGARSLMISAGGWPYCCRSNMSSINLRTFDCSLMYISKHHTYAWHRYTHQTIIHTYVHKRLHLFLYACIYNKSKSNEPRFKKTEPKDAEEVLSAII